MKNVQEAIAYVMSKVPYVKKTKSEQLGYSYASEAELIRVLHPAMVEAGLTMHPQEAKLLANDIYRTADKTYNGRTTPGKEMRRVMVSVKYKLQHAPSLSYEYVESMGEASDSSDKATSKAMTMALKYALRQLFIIETGDADPDSERPEMAECEWSNAMLSHFAKIGMLPKDKLEIMLSRVPQAKFKPEEEAELTKRINERLAAIDKGRNREPEG